MDAIEWMVYWIIAIPLAVLMLITGVVFGTILALFLGWQWCFSEAMDK